ncbi:TetR/AcrR family transcriptional regulator [Devosia lacusdianchii]|jgi:AcrR family transcriptional regulator|uniref:TetR/AcrR family transcriptional regulator n=1 Tax=Devosia lacusdianchii TaxID=2917991 RepID=UPI001F051BC4|nr:TetR/AcrR family transcriptional regulator [Devosia sp. JXJ CY 41]
MARRADHSREELVELVIEAARQMIATQGVDKLSARALSAAIGYTPGTLYNHFKDLDDIVTAVNGGTLKALGEAFAAAERSDDPRRMLHSYADAFLGFLRDNANLWNALFEFRRAEGVAVPQWYVDTISGLLRILAACFMQIRPTANPQQAAHAAQLVFASIHSVSSLQNSGRLALVMDRDIGVVVHDLIDIHIKAFAQG